jgi:hypothetical protein
MEALDVHDNRAVTGFTFERQFPLEASSLLAVYSNTLVQVSGTARV